MDILKFYWRRRICLPKENNINLVPLDISRNFIRPYRNRKFPSQALFHNVVILTYNV